MHHGGQQQILAPYHALDIGENSQWYKTVSLGTYTVQNGSNALQRKCKFNRFMIGLYSLKMLFDAQVGPRQEACPMDWT